MLNLNKKNPEFLKVLEDSTITTKIMIYFASKSAGDDFDPKENNYTYTNLNPLTIRGYVRDLKPEKQYWRQYGFNEGGAKEIYCDSRFANWFRKARKIEIDGDSYSLYSQAQGNRVLITSFPFKMIRVIVFKE